MRAPKRIQKFCNKLADIWEPRCPDWRFGQLLVNVIDRDPFFLEEEDMLCLLKKYFYLDEDNSGQENKQEEHYA